MRKTRARKDAPTITVSSGNVFLDIGFSPAEAQLLALKSQLMVEIRQAIASAGFTDAQAARLLRLSRPRTADLTSGRWVNFSLDVLVKMAVRMGRTVTLELRG